MPNSNNNVESPIVNSESLKKSLTGGSGVYNKDDPYANLMTGAEEESSSEDSSSTSCTCPEYWLATKIITDPTRRFISDETLFLINHLIEHNMEKTVYDSNNDGIVDRAEVADIANSILWENINNRPDIDKGSMETAVKYMHSHSNATSLLLLTKDSSNLPLWNKQEWPLPDRAKPSDLFRERLRNIVMDAAEPINAVDGDIWFELDDENKKIKNIRAKKNNSWYSLL